MVLLTPTLLSFHPCVCMFSQNKCCSTTRSHGGGVGNSAVKAKSTKLMHIERIILIIHNYKYIHVSSPDRVELRQKMNCMSAAWQKMDNISLQNLNRLETKFVQQYADLYDVRTNLIIIKAYLYFTMSCEVNHLLQLIAFSNYIYAV